MLFAGEGRCPEATHGQQQCRPEPGSRTPRHLYTRPSEGPELSLQGTEGVLVGSATVETAHPEDLAQQAPCCPGGWEPRLRGRGFRCLARLSSFSLCPHVAERGALLSFSLLTGAPMPSQGLTLRTSCPPIPPKGPSPRCHPTAVGASMRTLGMPPCL